MRIATAVAVALLALAIPAGALAAACPRTTLGDVENEVMCPVCGTPLGLATEAPQANREREFIRRQVAACKSKDEVKAALAAEFGDEVLALPDDEGFELAAYLVPGLALVIGAGAIGVAAVRWRRRRPPGSNEGGSGRAGDSRASEDDKRLDSDLERYDL